MIVNDFNVFYIFSAKRPQDHKEGAATIEKNDK